MTGGGRAQADDFRLLYERHQARLRAYVRRRLRGSAVDPDDVLQDGWLRVYRALDRGQMPATKREPWLYTVFGNACVDHLRASQRRALDGGAIDELPADVDGPEDRVLARELLAETLADLASLDPRQRDALLRHVLAGESHERIASRVGTDAQGSRSLISRARRSMSARAEARHASCHEIRRELRRAQRRGVRPSVRAVRHLAACAACHEYRERLRVASRRRLGLLPGPLTTKLALWLGGGLVTAGSLAVGAQVVLIDPERAPQRLPAELPGRSIAPGTPLPRGYALVRRPLDLLVRPAGRSRVHCPAGFRATQLLGVEAAIGTLRRYLLPLRFRPTARRGATITYAAAPGARRGEIGLLCRTARSYRRDRVRLRRTARRARALSRDRELALVTPGTAQALAEREARRAGLPTDVRRIPAGSVEHTIIELHSTTRPPRVVETWETATRWRSLWRARRSGRVLGESLGGPEGTLDRFGRSWSRTSAVGDRPSAGLSDSATRLLVTGARVHAGGLDVVAGRQGIVLRQPPSRLEQQWQELVVEPRTLAPLRHSTIGPGDVRHVAWLARRERRPLRDSPWRLDRAAKRVALARWRAEGATRP